jgi:hypothetical protein
MSAGETNQAVPAWFHNRVLDGLMFLRAIGLDGTPAAEVAQLNAQAWITCLWEARPAWDEGLDSARLWTAFNALSHRAERWPAPRAVLDHLPARPEPPLLLPPKSLPTAEQRAALMAARRRLQDQEPTR